MGVGPRPGQKIYGRYTLYGEFLMHEHTWGYVAPTPMFLRAGVEPSANYIPANDTVASILSRMGLGIASNVSGDLPFACGLASSTVLTSLHLGKQVLERDRCHISHVLDWVEHGFRPSGVDYAAIKEQRPGLFLSGRWRPAPELAMKGVFCRTRLGPERSPSVTFRNVVDLAHILVPLANRVTANLLGSGAVDRDALYQYCEVLATADAYSEAQRSLVRRGLESGLIAKGTGRLYNTATLLLGDDKSLVEFVGDLDQCQVIGWLNSAYGSR